jgi:hypothetical protein
LRYRGPHIVYTIGSQMAVRLSALVSGVFLARNIMVTFLPTPGPYILAFNIVAQPVEESHALEIPKMGPVATGTNKLRGPIVCRRTIPTERPLLVGEM